MTGVVIATTSAGPTDELTAARSMTRIRATYLAVTTAAAAGITGLAVLDRGGLGTSVATVRNLVAWTGLALLTGWALTPLVSWTAPLTWAFVVEWFGTAPDGVAAAWTVVRAPADDVLAWSIASAAFVLGVWSTCRVNRRTALRAAQARGRG